MALPVCKRTLITFALVAALVAVAFPFCPIVAASFETGLVVGLLLHSTYVSENFERGNAYNQKT